MESINLNKRKNKLIVRIKKNQNKSICKRNNRKKSKITKIKKIKTTTMMSFKTSMIQSCKKIKLGTKKMIKMIKMSNMIISPNISNFLSRLPIQKMMITGLNINSNSNNLSLITMNLPNNNTKTILLKLKEILRSKTHKCNQINTMNNKWRNQHLTLRLSWLGRRRRARALLIKCSISNRLH